MRLRGQATWTSDVQIQALEFVLFQRLLRNIIVVETEHGFLQTVHVFDLRTDGTEDAKNDD